jgi:hypothetical protein
LKTQEAKFKKRALIWKKNQSAAASQAQCGIMTEK